MQLVERQSEQFNHLNVHYIKTEKFKTLYFVVKLKAPLHKDTITKRALLPYVLRKGTESYPSEVKLQRKLDDLYGATLSLDGAKKGDYHIISARLEIANDKYIKDEGSLVDDSLALLYELIYRPKVNENAFDKQIFNREKETLKNSIESVIDDKMRYANMRLIDEMCKNERYAIRVHGYVEELEEITEKSLYTYYQNMLLQDDIDIYIVGDFEKSFMQQKIRDYFQREKHEPHIFEKEQIQQLRHKPKIIKEVQEINQAKLNIGYRTLGTIKDNNYFSLQVFNGLFGGFPSSKLFLNVREKHSLAYYAASGIESHKGLLLVVSGIDAKDFSKAHEIIDEQLRAIQKGDFTEENLEETKKQLVNGLLETLDHPNGIVELLYQQDLAQITYPLKEIFTNIHHVTKEDVIQVANQIQKDTVYLLTSKEGEPNEKDNS
ncbi:MAG TPA: pitrilysin family protein [Bacillota bacterium]|nr:pitrilysin family protein [Bacillota bacterium]